LLDSHQGETVNTHSVYFVGFHYVLNVGIERIFKILLLSLKNYEVQLIAQDGTL
jgi:hypothetical protein